jgi:hypothetical protein
MTSTNARVAGSAGRAQRGYQIENEFRYLVASQVVP